MKKFHIFLIVFVAVGIILISAENFWVNPLVNLILKTNQPTKIIFLPKTNNIGVPSQNAPLAYTYGMSKYVDSANGFYFWYPSDLKVTSTITNDSKSFPGGVSVETLQIGEQGGTYISVVNSKTSTIIDEPKGHASPIAQTKYSYDIASEQWMISYPEGTPTGEGSSKPTPIDINKTATTMSGLLMLPAGKRFDTTIIPLNMTKFIVVSDGGGSSFTAQLTATVSPAGISVLNSILDATLQAEGSAYTK